MKSRKEEFEGATLYLGDCLDVLAEIKEAHAVLMDPPYSSGGRTTAQIRGRGGMSRGEEWKNEPLPNDRLSVTGFTWLIRQVGLEANRFLVEGGGLLSFIDWRQYPTLFGCLETCNFQMQNLVVWDKINMGMGNGFRNQHELLLHTSKGTPRVFDRGVPNVIRLKRIASSEIHPTEKPVELLEQFVKVVTDVGDLVVDPFMGSGTTGAACRNLGRRFIGVEWEERYFEEACRRLAKPVQTTFFGVAGGDEFP